MPLWKVLALSSLGFAVPVVVAVFASPIFFQHIPSDAEYKRGWFGRSEKALQESLEDTASTPVFADDGVTFRRIPPETKLDPSDDRVFIANAVVRFDRLPAVGQRKRVFYKYAVANQPYSGWAFAVRRLPSSLRPEVYWQDETGRGGWFTFAEIPVREGEWNSFSFIVQNGDFLSLYWERLEEAALTKGSANMSVSNVKFSGGFEIPEVDSPRSDDPLFVAPGYSSHETTTVTVRQMLVAETEVAPFTMKSAIKLVVGGASAIASRLKDEQVRLWLTDDGRDRSQIAKSRSGSAQSAS